MHSLELAHEHGRDGELSLGDDGLWFDLSDPFICFS